MASALETATLLTEPDTPTDSVANSWIPGPLTRMFGVVKAELDADTHGPREVDLVAQLEGARELIGFCACLAVRRATRVKPLPPEPVSVHGATALRRVSHCWIGRDRS